MASTFTTDKVGSGVQPLAGIGSHAVYAEYELAAALVVNDVIQMVKVPAGARITEVILTVDDLDSGTQLVLDVGDGSDQDRFIKQSSIGQTGGTVRLGSGIIDGACNYKYTADDTIDVKVQTAPQTGATSGTVCLTVFYTMQQ